MAHHGTELDEHMKAEAKRLLLGATGEYPEGKLTDEDEGEIRIGIAADPKRGKVVMNFGKATAWITFDPAQASDLADSLHARSLEARGIT